MVLQILLVSSERCRLCTCTHSTENQKKEENSEHITRVENERERKKDTTTKRYASRAHTKHTLYAFGRAIEMKYQGNTPMNWQMPSNHLECVGTESKSVPLNFGRIERAKEREMCDYPVFA